MTMSNRNQSLIGLFIAFVFLNTLDYFLTREALRRGGVTEYGPLGRLADFEAPETMILKLAALPLIVAVFYIYISTIQGGHRILDLAAVMIPIIMAVVVINNLTQFPRSDKK